MSKQFINKTSDTVAYSSSEEEDEEIPIKKIQISRKRPRMQISSLNAKNDVGSFSKRRFQTIRPSSSSDQSSKSGIFNSRRLVQIPKQQFSPEDFSSPEFQSDLYSTSESVEDLQEQYKIPKLPSKRTSRRKPKQLQSFTPENIKDILIRDKFNFDKPDEVFDAEDITILEDMYSQNELNVIFHEINKKAPISQFNDLYDPQKSDLLDCDSRQILLNNCKDILGVQQIIQSREEVFKKSITLLQ